MFVSLVPTTIDYFRVGGVIVTALDILVLNNRLLDLRFRGGDGERVICIEVYRFGFFGERGCRWRFGGVIEEETAVWAEGVVYYKVVEVVMLFCIY